QEVYKHPKWGASILEEASVKELYQSIAYQHHERPDGSGYPEGCTSIHQFARIVSVFDVYEALTAPRAYQAPVDPLE
ncbi:MAG: HD-GYP domain-containing protein, partial [bacterium]